MSEFSGIDIKTLDDGGFQFCQNGLILIVYWIVMKNKSSELTRLD